MCPPAARCASSRWWHCATSSASLTRAQRNATAVFLTRVRTPPRPARSQVTGPARALRCCRRLLGQQIQASAGGVPSFMRRRPVELPFFGQRIIRLWMGGDHFFHLVRRPRQNDGGDRFLGIEPPFV